MPDAVLHRATAHNSEAGEWSQGWKSGLLRGILVAVQLRRRQRFHFGTEVRACKKKPTDLKVYKGSDPEKEEL